MAGYPSESPPKAADDEAAKEKIIFFQQIHGTKKDKGCSMQRHKKG